jgi:hypothetical protein
VRSIVVGPGTRAAPGAEGDDKDRGAVSVGEINEVMRINERDGLYALSGLGRFTMTRFEL